MQLASILRDVWGFLATRVDWQAWLTLAAVSIALYPIVDQHRRTKKQARNLRIRLGALLMRLRPSLGAVLLLPGDHRLTPGAELSREEFQRIVADVGLLMEHASILEAEELDQLGIAYLNLNAAAGVFATNALQPESACNSLKLIDATMSQFESNGLIVTKLDKPWDSSSDGCEGDD